MGPLGPLLHVEKFVDGGWVVVGGWWKTKFSVHLSPKLNNIRYWSCNYRGCWKQTCPQIDPRDGFKVISNSKASDESWIIIFRHYHDLQSLGNLCSCCLP